ncbi:MAG: alpha/beta fold hydrolase [Bacteroidota bacterium]
MPLTVSPVVKAPLWLPGGHLQTIYPALTRQTDLPFSQGTAAIPTPDGDKLAADLYLQKTESPRPLVILTHGLEGESKSPYILGMAAACYSMGTDVAAWNFRGCGESTNTAYRFYHSGATDDLLTVINSLEAAYSEIILIGFSLGGNLTLKLLGELCSNHFPGTAELRKKVKLGIVFSVPCDLASSSAYLERPADFIYERRFLRSLKSKVRKKAKFLPGKYDLKALDQVKTIREFDEHFTAPIHGFGNADNYYKMNSSKQFISKLDLPVFMVNARNDPFLPQACFPESEAAASEYFYLVAPKLGGHCGFGEEDGTYWSDRFVQELLGGRKY